MPRPFALTISRFDELWPQIEEALRQWYADETALSFDAAVEQAAQRYGDCDVDLDPTDGTIWDDIPELDSKRVVEALSMVEPLLDETIPVDVIKPGGYANADEFVDDLCTKLRAKCRVESESTTRRSTVPPQAQP